MFSSELPSLKIKSPLLNQSTPKFNISNAKILLVDDDVMNTHILVKALKGFDDVTEVHSGLDAIEFCKNSPPDLVILDVVMPVMDGYETCEELRMLPLMESCPIIFSTSLRDIGDEVECWNAGGTDFVSKPVIPETLIKRIRVHLELKLKSDLQLGMAFFDTLTGFGNRRYYDEFYQQQVSLAAREKDELSLVVLDIDYFKLYNDKYGHAEGDECLRTVSVTIKKQLLRPTDTAIRYGGEEFVIILPKTNKLGARIVADKIIGAIMKKGIPNIDSPYSIVTVSAGIASLGDSNDKDLFVEADQQLYNAKNMGRNLSVG